MPALRHALALALSLPLCACEQATQLVEEVADKVPTSAPKLPEHPALIAFSANMASGTALHRDGKESADLFVGTLDLDSGAVTDVHLVAGGEGAQWFPDLSPDGDYVAYNETKGGDNRVVVVNLVTMEAVTVAENGRFPAFSPDGRTLFYSTSPAGKVRTYDLRTGQTGTLVHPSSLEDPFPVGSGAIAGHTLKDGGLALPVVVDLASGRETVFDAKRFGHLTASPSGRRILAGDAGSSLLYTAEASPGGGWSEFQPIGGDLGASIRAADPRYAAAETVLPLLAHRGPAGGLGPGHPALHGQGQAPGHHHVQAVPGGDRGGPAPRHARPLRRLRRLRLRAAGGVQRRGGRPERGPGRG
jgi:hypothetical protein